MNQPIKQISITTGSRLHWGLLACGNDVERSFGGIGLMIDQPGVELSIRPKDKEIISGTDAIRQRVVSFIESYRANCPDQFQPPFCEISIQSAIPSHRGLGSGTQLAMAVAHGLALLAQDPLAHDASTIAKRVGRGVRSAVGINGFFNGGLIVDAGKLPHDALSPTIVSHPFPKNWRILLVTPNDEVGLSGMQEKQVFDSLSYSSQTTNVLCGILVRRLLPALVTSHFEEFSKAIYDYGLEVGTAFSKQQGGTFSSPLMHELSKELLAKGKHGHGQTSWGPTLFVLLPDEIEAHQLRAELKSNPDYQTCHFQIVKPLNRSASVQVT